MSGGFFHVLNLPPVAGRLLTDEDDRPGAGADGWPVMVSEAFAYRHFGQLVRYIATGRQRDFAIRLCLGASAGRMVLGVLREAAVLVIAGSLLGLGASRAVGQIVKSQLYGVQAGDAGVLGSAWLRLMTIGLLAVAGPALRTRRMDPMQLLREE